MLIGDEYFNMIRGHWHAAVPATARPAAAPPAALDVAPCVAARLEGVELNQKSKILHIGKIRDFGEAMGSDPTRREALLAQCSGGLNCRFKG